MGWNDRCKYLLSKIPPKEPIQEVVKVEPKVEVQSEADAEPPKEDEEVKKEE